MSVTVALNRRVHAPVGAGSCWRRRASLRHSFPVKLNRVITIAVLAVLCTGFGAGCGGTGQVSTAGRNGKVVVCGPFEDRDTASEILVRYSDLTCQQAEAFMVVLPNSPGRFNLATKDPEEPAAHCQVFAAGASPLLARCRFGSGVLEFREWSKKQQRDK